jgi:hypothetical protein
MSMKRDGPGAVAGRGNRGPVTAVLDSARYQRTDEVKGVAKELGVGLLFLPSYSPNLSRIDPWRFTTRKPVYETFHPTVADFRAAVEAVLNGVPAVHPNGLASQLTLNFQEFEDVSIPATRIVSHDPHRQ